MKQVRLVALSLGLLSLGLSAYAAAVDRVHARKTAQFLPSSPLPEILKERMSARLENLCSKAYFPKEIATQVTHVRVDSGIEDIYYETTFAASWNFDGIHPVPTTLTVKAAHFDVAHPAADPFPVLSVAADSDVCLKSPHGVAYLPTTVIPLALQTLIDQALDSRCAYAVRPIEVDTQVREVHVDSGVVDRYYDTTLWADYRDIPGGITIQVTSEDLALHNPPGSGQNVISLTSTSDACR